eukprot:8738220-Alexandrium_andersonii.AAC.1
MRVEPAERATSPCPGFLRPRRRARPRPNASIQTRPRLWRARRARAKRPCPRGPRFEPEIDRLQARA